MIEIKTQGVYEFIEKYGADPRFDHENVLSHEAVIKQAYNKGFMDGWNKSRQWIPCSERKPNNNEYDWVLAQVQEDNGNLWIPRVMEYRESKDDWYLDDENPCWLKECHGDKFKVIAWMPLPPVFEGNKE